MKSVFNATFVVIALLATSPAAHASEETADYVITIKNSDFSPKEVTIPANQKIKLTVKNLAHPYAWHIRQCFA